MIDLPSEMFLLAYSALNVAACILAVILRVLLLTFGPRCTERPVSLNAYEYAYLAGGPRRVFASVLASMAQRCAVAVDVMCKEVRADRCDKPSLYDAEKVVWGVLTQRGPQRVFKLRRVCMRMFEGMFDRLASLGLCPSGVHRLLVLALPAVIAASPVIVGLIRLARRLPAHRPVAILALLCMVPLPVALCFFMWKPHRSRTGDALLRGLRERKWTLKSIGWTRAKSMSPMDVAFAVALFGPSALRGGPHGRFAEALDPTLSGSDGGGDVLVDSGSGGGGEGGGFGDAF
jgi:uncharacterized protein (TIGR04222 family)